ncbi:MAG: hypothetical protein C0187_07080 [Calditerrivibrio nitroreducens]|jgi:hypothetical protein|uniref:Yip1 domain-containing protein n=1 Tax=Calditerrivibrio nitroreducens TaxID=477976 RepID=A0A2J6WGC3_9BACT|nr:MAG: hypothetical protein C0187_07080 [Calditerrivibrio nitroreducens]
MIGKMEAKNGEERYPGLIETFFCCLRLIFFSEKDLLRVYIDKRLTNNLITIFLLTLLIPYKSINSDNLYDLGNTVGGIFFTFFFILFLYLFIPNKNISFFLFLKLFLPLELINIFTPISFLLKSDQILYFTIILISWYLSLSVFIYSRVTGSSYFKSTVVVLLSFVVSNIMILLE